MRDVKDFMEKGRWWWHLGVLQPLGWWRGVNGSRRGCPIFASWGEEKRVRQRDWANGAVAMEMVVMARDCWHRCGRAELAGDARGLSGVRKVEG